MTRRRIATSLLVLAVAAAVAAGGLWWKHRTPADDGQALRIPEVAATRTVQTPGPSGPPAQATAPTASGTSYATAVSADGRYLVDQSGKPFLVRGDSPWSMLTDLLPTQVSTYLDHRQAQGVNSLIVSLVGATVNGGPSDDGGTVDGLRPFRARDVTDWEQPYWDRAHAALAAAAAHGMTVFLYPIDGWTIGHAFVPATQRECEDYGRAVAQWAADLPNIVWMSGGDYFPATDDLAAGSDVDHCIDRMLTGIRSTGDVRPFSVQLGGQKSVTTDNPYWAARSDFAFVYTYWPTYAAVLESYGRTPVMPALLGEANYEGENNTGGPATTNETLRRQTAWALTSGSPGDFAGTADWGFADGWEQRLDSDGVRQVGVVRDVVAALPWWTLRPDTGTLLTAGRGERTPADQARDVLESDWATAARSEDGRYAVVYVPTARTLGLDVSALAPGSTAAWVDPSTGARTPVTLAPAMTTPGRNADGGDDWLLVVTPG